LDQNLLEFLNIELKSCFGVDVKWIYQTLDRNPRELLKNRAEINLELLNREPKSVSVTHQWTEIKLEYPILDQHQLKFSQQRTEIY
jgi:hypothetical protein